MGCQVPNPGHSGYLVFVWVYGLFLAGYQYSLKMFVFQKVRARNFPSAWGFVQVSQAVSVLVGVPITGYINSGLHSKAGYYFSAFTVLAGGLILTAIDLHRRLHRHQRRRKRKKMREDARKADGEAEAAMEEEEEEEEEFDEKQRRNSFPDVDEDFLPASAERHQLLFYHDIMDFKKPELTCISEEGIADMELPDNLLAELEIELENITSCNKVENYLMLSEYEQNLSKENDSPLVGRRSRRRNLVRQNSTEELGGKKRRLRPHQHWRLGLGGLGTGPAAREITTIDEDSV